MSALKRFAPLVAVIFAAMLVGNLVYNVEHLQWGAEEEAPVGYRQSSADSSVSNNTAMSSALRYIFAGAMILMITAGIALGVSKALTDRKGMLKSLAAQLLVVGIAVAFFVFIIAFAGSGGRVGKVPLPFSGGGGASTGAGSNETQGQPTTVVAVIYVVIAVSFIAMIVGGFTLLRRTRGTHIPMGDLELKRKEAVDVLDRAMYDITAGGDYKRAVLQCYKDMVKLCATKGVADDDYLTAREFEAMATKELALGPELHDLTMLFEEARYSRHVFSEEQKKKALKDLEVVKASLLTAVPAKPRLDGGEAVVDGA